MPNSNQHVRERQRLDFAKIQGSIQIPNLIEVQMKSYQRFLQMDLLPSERDDAGLQSVFTSVFPIKDFREMSQLEFVDYSIGNWECKCGNLKGLHHLRATCRNCGASVVTNPYQTGDVICHKCGTFNKNTPTFRSQVRQPEGPAPPSRDLPQLRCVRSHQSISNRRRHLPQVRHVQQEHADLPISSAAT